MTVIDNPVSGPELKTAQVAYVKAATVINQTVMDNADSYAESKVQAPLAVYELLGPRP